MKKILSGLLFLSVMWGPWVAIGLADSRYAFDCGTSSLKGSIKYSVIGSYRSTFKDCSGVIVYDETKEQIKSVKLEVQTDSIHSNCEWCDHAVVSKQLLDAEKYPVIAFEGIDFAKDSDGYWVKGMISLHGVTQELNSQFYVEDKSDDELVLKGKWVLRRKDFKIVWNKVLDHGGVLVGDHMTVDWTIRAKRM